MKKQMDYILPDETIIEIEKKANETNMLIAKEVLTFREYANLTQKQLSEKTGIYQAEISKIERGIGNPSVQTLERIAKGLGVKLDIHFVVDK